MFNTYTQVLLSKPVGKAPQKGGWTFQVVWIPTEFAKVGKYLEIAGENGWKVEECYAAYDKKFIEKHSHDFKTAFPSIQGKTPGGRAR